MGATSVFEAIQNLTYKKKENRVQVKVSVAEIIEIVPFNTATVYRTLKSLEKREKIKSETRWFRRTEGKKYKFKKKRYWMEE